MNVMNRGDGVYTKRGESVRLFHKSDSAEVVNVGDSLVNFRGEAGTFMGLGDIGRTGNPKLLVDKGDGRTGEYYAQGWGVTWEYVD